MRVQTKIKMVSVGSASLILFSVLIFSVSFACSKSISEHFLHCTTNFSTPSEPISTILHTPANSSYSSILDSTIQNLRLLPSENSKKPLFIFTPAHETHVQAAVICSRKLGLHIKVRSGGHDYEGLSYLSDVPFIIVDLRNLRSVIVNMEDKTALVQGGATVGEVYQQIAGETSTYGFPSGLGLTIGVGGVFSGGGLGIMMRKYGLSSDNVIDVSIVDVNGRILDRKSMGEDLFWAIRGGGGASFGVIVSWTIRLVSVPPTVTVFTVTKTLEEGATELVHRWQHIADKFHENLFIRIIVSGQDGKKKGERTVVALFNSMYLGGMHELLPLMEKSFPELGLKAKDCIEMPWINSTLYFNGYAGKSQKKFFKAKSDFVKEPIPENVWKGIWKLLLEGEGEGHVGKVMIMDPFGGRMSEISESETPFPHRAGNLFNIQYMVEWKDGGARNSSKKHIEWIRRLYKFMTQYVSSSPRTAYLNYRDLDLGKKKRGNISYSSARVWGSKYFKNNFKRLALVKSKIDPDNFFWNEQSIPPL